MKKYILYIGVGLSCLQACKTEEESTPDYLIERDVMVDLITEVELTQALIKVKFTTTDTINSLELYKEVFEQFEVSEEQFNKSLMFYCKDPKTAEKLYVEAIERLSEKESYKDQD